MPNSSFFFTEMRYFLVGFMGCGKTFWGRKLAAQKGVLFVDLDDFIEYTGGGQLSIAQIFAMHGETYFRALEHKCLEHIIENYDNVVVATGGGAPCFHDNMALMNQHGTTIYLKTAPHLLLQRLSKSDEMNKRPLLKNKSNEEIIKFIEQKLIERQPFYEAAQQVILQGDDDIFDNLEKIL